MKRFAALVMTIFLLLGLFWVQKPEAQLGEAITLASGVIAFGGCVHAGAVAKMPASQPYDPGSSIH